MDAMTPSTDALSWNVTFAAGSLPSRVDARGLERWNSVASGLYFNEPRMLNAVPTKSELRKIERPYHVLSSSPLVSLYEKAPGS